MGRILTLLTGVLLCSSLVAGAAAQGVAEAPSIAPGFFALQVADVAAASVWYSSVLELEVVARIDAEDGSYSIRLLKGSGLTVELIRMADAPERPPERHLGLFKVGIYVDDIDAMFARLRARGVDTDARVFHDEALRVRSFVFRDPDGNRIQVLQPT